MKSVIITGGSGGYGLAEARAFREAGYTVLITARNEEKLRAAQKECGADFIFPMDVTRPADWEALRAFAAAHIGVPDVLVNNAGGGVHIAPLEEQTPGTIEAAISLNLTGTVLGAYTFAPAMKQRGSGTIINISSVCARHAWGGWSVYAAAKAGVLAFTKGLQVELQPHGVRASCIIPAAASTGFQQASGIGEVQVSLATEDIARAVLYAAELPPRAILEEMTVWGMSQIVEPL